MAIEPTNEELLALSHPKVPPPGDGGAMPDPEPEVVERAQKILDKVNSGQSLSQVSAGPEERPVSLDFDNDQLLAFMAHVLGGKEYQRTYTALGRLKVTFKSLSPAEEELVNALVRLAERDGSVDKTQRRQQYLKYAMACAIVEATSDGDGLPLPGVSPRIPIDEAASNYQNWFNSISGGYYRVLDQLYREFVADLGRLYAKVDDPDFWPTPS